MNETGKYRSRNIGKFKGELFAKYFFTLCGFVAIFAVFSITIYLIVNGIPALFELGINDILFTTVWKPAATEPEFGILYIIITSIVGTLISVFIGVPIGIFTAIFLSETGPKKIVAIVKPAISVLAGIPSVVYGLLGVMILNPFIYQLELKIFANNPSHTFTGGSNLLSAIIVLSVMILPTVIQISESSLRAVPPQLKSSSLGLGASKIQTIFKVQIPAAKSGILTAVVLGIGRAVGEAMAITLVSGGAVNIPLPFHSVRFLTTAIVSEMSYATGMHRKVLFTIGLVLFLFIAVMNFTFNKWIQKRSDWCE